VGKKSARGKTLAKLLVAMPRKASATKRAASDAPVFAYIASVPQPQRGIAERIDAKDPDQGVKTCDGLIATVDTGYFQFR
jgi:hypothetical protein